jgi:hypothetical protein
LQFGTGVGPTYITSNYEIAVMYQSSSGSGTPGGVGTTAGNITIFTQGLGTSGSKGSGASAIIEGMSSGNYTTMNYQSFGWNGGSYIAEAGSGVQNSNTNAKTAIQIFMSSGNISSGSASLYGISS